MRDEGGFTLKRGNDPSVLGDTANLGSYEIFHGLVTKQTLTLAYIDIFWCFQMLALVGIVLVLVLWPNARRAASTVVRRVFVLAFNGVRRSPAVASSQ